MNSFTYLFLYLLTIVPVCHSLTLNEKGIERDSTLASSRTNLVTHSQQVPVRKLHEGTLNVAEGLAQLRIELDKADITRDSGDRTHLLENSSRAETAAIKSLMTSTPLKKNENHVKSLQQDSKSTKGNQVNKLTDAPGMSSWAMSGGGCHSSISQYGMIIGYELSIGVIVKKFLQGERFTKASLRGVAPPNYHTTSSGGTWMWVSLLSYITGWDHGLFGYAASWEPAEKRFMRRNGVGWIDAIVVPNEDPQQWGKILQHSLGGGEKNSAFQRKEDAEMNMFQDMVKSALHFYVSVREDPSLRNLDMQEIVEAELAAEVSKGVPEVQAIAAQYDITPTSHPLLLKAIQKDNRANQKENGVPHILETILQSDFDGHCDINNPSEIAYCSFHARLAIFGPMSTCVRKGIDETSKPILWSWETVGCKKFMQPWGLPCDTKFSDLITPSPDEAWEIITTSALVQLGQPSTPGIFGHRVMEGGINSGDLVKEKMGASGNWGLSAFYLLYYTSVTLKCVPDASTMMDYAIRKNLTKKYWDKLVDTFSDTPTGQALVYAVMNSAMDYEPETLADLMNMVYYFPVDPVDDMIYMDGASSDNVGFAPVLWMISDAGVESCAQYQMLDPEAPPEEACGPFLGFWNELRVSQITPTLLVTSTGDDAYDFQAVASYFTHMVPRRYAPPSLEMMLPFDLLCPSSIANEPVGNPNHLLEFSEVTAMCLNVQECDSYEQVWGMEPPCVPGADNVWSKMKTTGILYMPRVNVVSGHGMGHYQVKAMTVSFSIATEMSFTWLTIYPNTVEREDDIPGAWSSYHDQHDADMASFPTLQAQSLMNVPVKYAFALMQYTSHLSMVSMQCVGTPAGIMGPMSEFAQSHQNLVPCSKIRCEEAMQYEDFMTFPILPHEIPYVHLT